MMFELKTPTKVRVLDVRVLSKKDRPPDEPAGAQLLLRANLPVETLGMFVGKLPGVLYQPRAKERSKQDELDGIESAELSEIGEHITRLPWVYEQGGCTLTIDGGISLPNLVLIEALVHRVSIRPEQKGAIVQWTVDIPALSDATRGRLTGLKSTDVQLLLVGPDASAQAPLPNIQPDQNTPKAGAASKKALDASGVSPFPPGGRRGGARPAAAVE